MDLFQKQDWKSASGLFEKAVHANPQYAQAYEAWGRAELYAENLDHSLELSQKAIALNPSSYAPYEYLAAVYRVLNEPEKAEAVLAKFHNTSSTETRF